MPAPFQRIGIVGSGSIGIYYGTRLGVGGADVRFLMRRDLAAVKARGSVRVKTPSQSIELSPVSAFATPAEMGPVDLVVVAMKTTAGGALPDLIGPLLGPETVILTLQNGLGADELLADLFGASRIVGGLVFMGVNRTGPGEVSCVNEGSVAIGEFGRPAGGRALEVAGQMKAAGIAASVVDSLLGARWSKLTWNIPFNGLSIVEGGIATNRICANPVLADEVRALMLEVQRAAAGFGFEITDEFLAKQFDKTPPMGAYQPSSLVDFLALRSVEVEAIWGEPLRRAHAIGIEMPRLAALYSRLKAVCFETRAPFNP